jgi:SCY1-like protein 1
VLLNAFTRALRDGFPPARVAGLKAIVATAKYHSAEDAALRVLPAVAPLCVDAVHEVRASALDCVQHFAAQLAQHHKELERKAAELQEGQAAGAAHDAAAGAPGSSSGGSLLNSFGWAVSNLGLGRSSAADVGGKTPAAAAAAVGSQAPVPGVAPSGRLPAAPAPRAAPAVAADAGSNGWGNDGDFDDAAGLDAGQFLPAG